MSFEGDNDLYINISQPEHDIKFVGVNNFLIEHTKLTEIFNKTLEYPSRSRVLLMSMLLSIVLIYDE